MDTKKLEEINLENLKLVSEVLKDFDFFIFYGTLLGITRSNNILKGDDDVGFFIDIELKEKILEKISLLNHLQINKKVENKYFIQFINNKYDTKTFIDFYFFINDKKKDYIVEKHNWLSSIDIEEHSLHIPKSFIFPIKKSEKFNYIKLPNKQNELCEFLYGKSWQTPLTKNSEYRMEIIDHKPKLIRRSFIGSLNRKIKEFFTNKFQKK